MHYASVQGLIQEGMDGVLATVYGQLWLEAHEHFQTVSVWHEYQYISG